MNPENMFPSSRRLYLGGKTLCLTKIEKVEFKKDYNRGDFEYHSVLRKAKVLPIY